MAGNRLIVSGDTIYAQAIAAQTHAVFNPNADQCLARVEDGKLFGGVIYQGYTGVGGSVQMHMAGFVPNWANRDMLWIAFDYPFNQLKCGVVFGQVSETNTKALDIDLKLGFKMVAKIDGVFPDGACYVMRLARDECRWLNLKPRSVKSASEITDGRQS